MIVLVTHLRDTAAGSPNFIAGFVVCGQGAKEESTRNTLRCEHVMDISVQYMYSTYRSHIMIYITLHVPRYDRFSILCGVRYGERDRTAVPRSLAEKRPKYPPAEAGGCFCKRLSLEWDLGWEEGSGAKCSERNGCWGSCRVRWEVSNQFRSASSVGSGLHDPSACSRHGCLCCVASAGLERNVLCESR